MIGTRRIAVIGGTGLIGRKLAALLDRLGQEVIVAARATGVDLLAGTGLDRALAGADVVVDVSSPGYGDTGEMRRFFESAAAGLLGRERDAGVAHHVVLSAVGAGRFHGGYFDVKKAQEDMVRASGLPFTILRSTPFFEYVYGIVDSFWDGRDIRLPPAAIQPVAADDVAEFVSRIALARPRNGMVEIAGPDACRLPTLATMILTANEDPRHVTPDEDAPFFGARIGREALTCGLLAHRAPTRFEDWLRQSLTV